MVGTVLYCAGAGWRGLVIPTRFVAPVACKVS